ncbi:LysE family translocator [Leeia sp.]|uniref:LysE family translocator n=1 Tax=Leeia sp. TaxID=2884678 RepID=UPI0035B31BE9
MLDLATLSLFSLAALLLTITPGPDMLLMTARTLSQGRYSGFATLAGIQTGTYLHALAAALGLSQLMRMVPLAYDGVRIAGALYLLWLAIQTLRSPATAAATDQPSPLRMGQVYRQGLLCNVLNPKMALFVLALFPQFTHPAAGSMVLQFLLLATVLNLIGLVVNGVVILLAHQVMRRMRGQAPRRWPRYLLGGVFGGLALRMLWPAGR